MSTLVALVLALTLPLPVEATSHTKLRGKRLVRFEKSGGRSELGRAVAVVLPGGVLDAKKVKRFGRSRTLVALTHRGVTYVVARNDPYYLQARRKFERSGKGKLLVKGAVVPVKRKRGGKEKAMPSVVVRVKSMQKFGKGKR